MVRPGPAQSRLELRPGDTGTACGIRACPVVCFGFTVACPPAEVELVERLDRSCKPTKRDRPHPLPRGGEPRNHVCNSHA
ncbi:hypothetical protein GOODEAATRI_032476, partial [Goodea atripinnis]